MSIFAAFILALIISLLFAPGYRRGSFSALVIFFLVLFFTGLAGQYWIIPFGPVWWGISWGPLLFTLLIFTFLFAAPSPYDRRDSEEKPAASAAAAISIFLWLLFTMLLIAILIGILRTPASLV